MSQMNYVIRLFMKDYFGLGREKTEKKILTTKSIYLMNRD
jgi:hypothetical protein